MSELEEVLDRDAVGEIIEFGIADLANHKVTGCREHIEVLGRRIPAHANSAGDLLDVHAKGLLTEHFPDPCLFVRYRSPTPGYLISRRPADLSSLLLLTMMIKKHNDNPSGTRHDGAVCIHIVNILYPAMTK